MMGPILLLLLLPIVLWVLMELLVRYSRAPLVWELFGFSVGRQREDEADTERGRLGRPPMLPERLSVHDRRPLPVYDPLGEERGLRA